VTLQDEIERAKARVRHCEADALRIAAQLERAADHRVANDLRHELQLRAAQCAGHEKWLRDLEAQQTNEVS
jgi:hypothetical protein